MRTTFLLNVIKRRLLTVVAIFSLVLSLVPSSSVFAEANQLYISPPSSQMSINTVFDINIRSYADSESGTGTANGTVTYPTDKLQVVGTPSTAGSNYGTPQITLSSGAVSFTASRPSNTGPQIFSIKFKAIGSGSATVGFATSSRVNGQVPILKTGTFTITNPNPPASSTPKPPVATPKPSTAPIVTTPPTDSPIPSTGPVVTPDPTGLIDSVSITSMYSSAKVSWKVNAPDSASTFAYGFTASQLDKKITPTKKADGSFEVTVPSLVPGARYIFYVTATGSGNKSGNYTSTIFTRGYPVTIKVTENGKTVTKGQIRIGTTTGQITSTGVATIGLASGNYTGTITTDTASLAINLTVESKNIPADGTAPESQTFNFGLTSSIVDQGPGSGETILTFVIVLIGGSIALAMGFVGFMAYRRKKFESDGDSATTYQNSGPSVVIDDGYTWHDPSEKTPGGELPSSPYESPTQNGPEPDSLPKSHNNSVYINEEEPVDMFDQPVSGLPQTYEKNPTQNPIDETEQNPNSPRSTRL